LQQILSAIAKNLLKMRQVIFEEDLISHGFDWYFSFGLVFSLVFIGCNNLCKNEILAHQGFH
jgi:hypothetical protein